VSEEAGRRDGHYRFGDHRFNHQVGQCVQLVPVQFDYAAIALDELVEFVLVEIVGPVGGVRPAADDGELQHAVGKVGNGRGDPDGVEIEHCGDFAFGKEHISRMPVAVDYLPGPGVEVEAADADARFVVQRHERIGSGSHFHIGQGRVFGADGL